MAPLALHIRRSAAVLAAVVLPLVWGAGAERARAQDPDPTFPDAPVLVLTETSDTAIPVGPWLEWLDEEASQYSFQALSTPVVAERFTPISEDRLSFRGDRWLRLRVRSMVADERQMALTFDSGRIGSLILYAPDETGTYRGSNAGSLTPCSDREVCSRFPSFLFEIQGRSTTTLYLRADADRLFSSTPHLRSIQNFASIVSWDRMAYGAQYGIIIALILFLVVVYASARTRAALFLGLFLAAAGLYGGVIEGTIVRAMPFEVSAFDREVIKRVLETLATVFLLHFGTSMTMGPATPWRRIRRLIRGVTWLCVAALPAGILFPMQAVWANALLGLAVLIFLVSVYVVSARGTAWHGQLQTLGAYVLVFGFVLYGLALYAVAHSESDLVLAVALPIDLYGLPTTIALFAVFSTMAVVREMYRQRRERDLAQADTLQQLLDDKALREQWNVHLEKEIEKRTSELERTKSQLEAQNFELRRHERQLEAQAQQLQELQAHKSRFFAYISHEFRTPITLIRARVEDIVSDFAEAKPADTRRRLDTVLQNTYRLEHLVDEVLDLSRVEEGTVSLRAARGDLSAFARQVIDQHVQLAEQKGLELSCQCNGGPVTVYFDEEMMTKVVTNLLSNAIKFSGRGGRIEVWVSESTADPDTGYARIDVVDQGPGIPADDLPHIFERFFQSVKPGAQPRVGHGLGLPLTKHLVELHGGEIRVSSDEGRGSTFSIFLPKGRAHLTDSEIVADRPRRPAVRPVEDVIDEPVVPGVGGQPRLLIVEDEPELLAYLREHFELEYDVSTAIDGVEGLRMAREVRPECIITDVLMPRMDGLEMLAALRNDAQLQNTPVLILSAKASIEDRLTAYQAAADGYISKPFDLAELRIRVRNIVRTRRALLFSRAEAAISVDGQDLPVDNVDAAFLAAARAAVMEHLDQEDFDVEAFAEALNMSSRTLHRRMRDLVDMPPAEFIRTIRLQAARHLIEQNAVTTVSEVATRVGFKSASYFTRLYREVFGNSPSDVLAAGNGTED